MECQEVKEMMPEFVRGELPKNKMNEISSHLNTCNDCCEELEKWDELFTELRSLVNYTHKPELKIDFSSKEKTSLTPWIVGGVGVGMLLAAGGALLWRRK